MIEQTPEGWWVVSGDTHAGLWVKMHKRLDHDQFPYIVARHFVKQGSLVLDIGGNIGTHTFAYLDAVGPNGIVVAYEPHPDSYECLRRNCPKATCINLAVGEKPEENWLVHNPNVGASHLSRTKTEGSYVKVVTLDDQYTSFLKELPWSVLSYIKIDVEGCEPEVLRGASNLIDTFRPNLLIEVNNGTLQERGHTYHEIQDFLTRHRYTYSFNPKDATWTDPMPDILCTPT